MIEFRTAIVGADSREVYEEYAPVYYPAPAPLEVRFEEAVVRLQFWQSALRATGISEPLMVIEDAIPYTDQDVAQLRAIL